MRTEDSPVTVGDINRMTDALGRVPDSTHVRDVPAWVWGEMTAAGASYEVAAFAQELLTAMVKLGGRT